MVVRVHRLLLMIFLVLLPVIAVANITVTVDRNVIEEGETFQLTIVADEGEPDTSVLNRDFNVLGTAKSNKVSITNGSVKRINELIIRLSPKTTGTLVIPAIRSGNDTSSPIRLKVTPPTFAESSQGADIFLEGKVDSESVYVQSQVIYTIRLYRAVEIREGSLTEPDLGDAVVERLGEDVTFQTRRDGRLYHVTERRFAIFPQKSGEFTIAPTIFQGQVVENTGRQQSGDPFNRFFQNQRTKRVRAKSDFIHLTIKPEPINVEGEVWLPAKRLVLIETWSPDPPVFKVGEPVTRTLRIEAEGLTAAQLPELKPLNATGVKQYADQPVVETVQQAGNLFGVREEKFAIVPTQSGQLVLPELRFHWWNTEMNQEEVISIPRKIIDVLPSEIQATQQNPISTQTSNTQIEASTPVFTKETLITVVEAGYWPFVAAAALFAWLLSSIGWWVSYRKNQLSRELSLSGVMSQDSVSLSAAIKQLKQACDKNDAMAAKKAVIAGVRSAWPDEASPSVFTLSAKGKDEKLDFALRSLNQHLYAADKNEWNGAAFFVIVKPHLNSSSSRRKKADNALPDLYPKSR